jgi:hypothetical protein
MRVAPHKFRKAKQTINRVLLLRFRVHSEKCQDFSYLYAMNKCFWRSQTAQRTIKIRVYSLPVYESINILMAPHTHFDTQYREYME